MGRQLDVQAVHVHSQGSLCKGSPSRGLEWQAKNARTAVEGVQAQPAITGIEDLIPFRLQTHPGASPRAAQVAGCPANLVSTEHRRVAHRPPFSPLDPTAKTG